MKAEIKITDEMTVRIWIAFWRVEFRLPNVPDKKFKELIETSRQSPDKVLFHWLSLYYLIYGEMPVNYKKVVWGVLKEVPLSQWIWIPYLFNALEGYGRP